MCDFSFCWRHLLTFWFDKIVNFSFIWTVLPYTGLPMYTNTNTHTPTPAHMRRQPGYTRSRYHKLDARLRRRLRNRHTVTSSISLIHLIGGVDLRKLIWTQFARKANSAAVFTHSLIQCISRASPYICAGGRSARVRVHIPLLSTTIFSNFFFVLYTSTRAP